MAAPPVMPYRINLPDLKSEPRPRTTHTLRTKRAQEVALRSFSPGSTRRAAISLRRWALEEMTTQFYSSGLGAVGRFNSSGK
jgi:hypothetical protein